MFILKKFFPSLLKANLSNIVNYTYFILIITQLITTLKIKWAILKLIVLKTPILI